MYPRIGIGVPSFRSAGGGTPPAPSLLLDTYSDAVAAYSLRKLRSAYNGSAISIRRESDNDELNIGFVNNELDTASLINFCSETNGFVTAWYDQSGNGVDLTQGNILNQPQIVSNGSLLTEQGIPVFQAEANVDWLENLIGIDLFGNSGHSTFCVMKQPTNQTVSAGSGAYFSYGVEGTGTCVRMVFEKPSSSSNGVGWRVNAGNKLYNGDTISNSVLNSYNLNYINNMVNYTDGSLYVNGVELPFVSSATSSSVNFGKGIVYINRGIGNGPPITYQATTIWGEAIVYPFDQEALGNNFDIITNQKNYWGLP